MNVVGPVRQRAIGLDWIRAAAILLVIAHHYKWLNGFPSSAYWVAQQAYIGVDLFFVLSGWLIGGQLLREWRDTGRVRIWRFWARRWFRTVPAYLAALWMATYAFYLVPVDGLGWFLAFAQNYVDPSRWIMSWSLCVEEHFYLLLPLIVLAAGRAPRAAIWSLAAVAVLAPPALRAMSMPASFEEYLLAFYQQSHLRFDGLALGVVCSGLHVYRSRIWTWMHEHRRVLAACGIALIVLTTWNPWLVGWTSEEEHRIALFPAVWLPFCASFGTALLLPLASELRGRGGVASRVATWISEHAYALYLVNESVFHFMKRTAHERPIWITLPLGLALTLVVAAGLRAVVEEPMLRLRDRLLSERRPSTAKIERAAA